MYAAFFGLERLPFDGSPDPFFLFASPAHKEAMAAIACGLEMGKGLTLITGEVGLGKTTLLRAYLAEVDRARFDVLYLFHPRITFDELLELIAAEIGAPPATSEYSRLGRVQQHLVERYVAARRRLVVVVDEAQRLSRDTLEGLRLLSNLESNDEKLIQIVLVGQPEIEAILAEPGMRQLNQRIALRARLAPLSRGEAAAYIRHRLTRAGAGDPDRVLAPAAQRVLVDHAGGVPRVINIIADNALLNAYGTDQRPVSAPLMRAVIAEQVGLGAPRHRRLPPRLRPSWRAAAGLAAATGLAAGVIVVAPSLPGAIEARVSAVLGEAWQARPTVAWADLEPGSGHGSAARPQAPTLVVTLPRRPASLQAASGQSATADMSAIP